MKKIVFYIFALISITNIFAQAPVYRNGNIDLLGTWDDAGILPNGTSVNNRYSSCWGYAQKGREYAIVGAQNGTYIVDITNPKSPVKKGFIPGRKSQSIWREYKTYKNYLYCVSDDTGASFQIVDLSTLPDSISVVSDNTILFSRGHTISIDQDKMYISGGNNALTVYSLADPKRPKLLREIRADNPAASLAHDVYVHKDTIWGSFGYGGFEVYHFQKDNTFKLLGSFKQYPFAGYNHSSLLLPDGKNLVMMDEVPASLPIKVVDISDLSDIKLVTTFTGGSSATPHNPFPAPNKRVAVTYYQDGLQIYDLSNPKNPKRTGFFDTHYQSDTTNTTGGYLGAWSAYTELPSLNVIVVDMQNGLYVLDARKAYGLTINNKDILNEEVASAFPNPIQDEITLRAINDENADLQIIDLTGRVVWQQNDTALDGFRLSTKNILSTGIYILKINNQRFTQSIKIVKQ